MTNPTLKALHDLNNDQTVSSDKDWDTVVSCLHWKGTRNNTLPAGVVSHAWSLADGFGKQPIKFIEETLEWDWSHIRDSSPAAIKEMAEYLRGHLDLFFDN